MNPFSYIPAATTDAALSAITAGATSDSVADDRVLPRFIAGGTNLLDLMKENISRPSALVDVNALALSAIESTPQGGMLLGALARNADTAYHPGVRRDYPLLTSAILAGASPQIRNMASNGGNLLQRTRCYYFYDVGVPCNKRNPGSGCPARDGLSRNHAVLGASEHCIATHPSDMCVALAALEAVVHVRSQQGTRSIAMADFHRLPDERPDVDTNLRPDELITGIELPSARQFAAHSAYLKLRDRASYAFALVSVAAMLDFAADGTVRQARIALGGVAHKPWRVPDAEACLVGLMPTAENFQLAADRLLQGARAYGTAPTNGFKIPMAQRAVVRALMLATEGTVTNDVAAQDSDDTGERT
ncbi:xanthine dehydrogenase family protein subunit M [Herbaspirillum sp. YR522]|uniref:FAD binding domain-containing protein n=1 Tax=Herbaspirillum sp. YR522 TaxID=1144342 RepID=UPI00026F4A3E|nr:xanthine dehydrogenase family protein subunit M [Herbaspirillum sp. YR522]EJN10308.1 aerobic-type carbon monoxide dehydrogenase, middle subunit CoxM/CutM-like protein [Herbaspirillum sp. YR522]